MFCIVLGKVSPRMYRRNLKMDAADAPDHVGSREVGGCETSSDHIRFDLFVSVETTSKAHFFINSFRS